LGVKGSLSEEGDEEEGQVCDDGGAAAGEMEEGAWAEARPVSKL